MAVVRKLLVRESLAIELAVAADASTAKRLVRERLLPNLGAIAAQLLAIEVPRLLTLKAPALLALETSGLLTLKATSTLALEVTRLPAFEAASLLAFETASALAIEGPRLFTLKTAALLPFDALLRSRETAAAVAPPATTEEGAGFTATALTASTSAKVECRPPAATAAAAVTAATTGAGVKSALSATAAAIAAITATAVAAAGLCRQRGRNRQSGDSRGKEYPAQHEESPFERRKRPVRSTVPTVKRMELAA